MSTGISDISSNNMDNLSINTDVTSINTENASNISTILKRIRSPSIPLENRVNDDILLEAGLDEAGRGCLSGPVFTACVILPDSFPDNVYMKIKDSKKLSKKARNELRQYIEQYAISYSVDKADVDEIDSKNILHATIASMHRAISNLKVKPEYLAVDGNYWKPYRDNGEIIPHILVKGGDNKYRNIAAASILAKTYHDDYIENLLETEKELCRYDWANNMCYGTKSHIEAIEKYGISKYHRKTFGICKEFA